MSTTVRLLNGRLLHTFSSARSTLRFPVQPRIVSFPQRQSSRLSTPPRHFREMASMQSNPLKDAIAEDHQEMYGYYEQYVQNAGNIPAQQRWANQLFWEIVRHAVGEEIVVYPLMEEYLGDRGLQLTDQDREDHQYVKEHLYRLEGLQVGTPEYSDMLKDVMDHLRKHNDSEEQTDLPLLTAQIGRDGSELAAAQFKRTKKFAPTHPHPSAPNKPPFETLVGLMTAPIDKLRDAFEQFPSTEEKESIGKN